MLEDSLDAKRSFAWKRVSVKSSFRLCDIQDKNTIVRFVLFNERLLAGNSISIKFIATFQR